MPGESAEAVVSSWTGHQTDILRFATAGSVDDGKSTLVGRLLFDSKAIFEDQLAAVERTSRARGEEYTNLALLTDELRAEREQGITIDVAYRYFATPRRKFIIADTPGHIQYTRNMVTGASTAASWSSKMAFESNSSRPMRVLLPSSTEPAVANRRMSV